jgi:hypothetical protein
VDRGHGAAIESQRVAAVSNRSNAVRYSITSSARAKSVGGTRGRALLWPAMAGSNLSFALTAHNDRRLTPGEVGVAQDVGFELQIFQSIFNHIADADNTGELAVA